MPRTIRPLLALCPVLLLAACNNTPAPPAGSMPPEAALTQGTGLAEDGRGDGYEYHVRYPELDAEWTALNRALRSYAGQRIQALLAAVGAAGERSPNAEPVVLDLEFNVARRTEDFVSVLAQGSLRETGKTEPLAAAFVLHAQDKRLLAITDLFADPAAALHALSAECARQLDGRFEASLRQSIADAKTLATTLKTMQDGVAHGTAPQAENFAVFLVDGIDSKAIGLTLFFAQAQLGVGSGGEQQVEVPAKVFYELLKPEFRAAFSVDVKELAAGAH